MPLRRDRTPELSEAARHRLEALRRELAREAGHDDARASPALRPTDQIDDADQPEEPVAVGEASTATGPGPGPGPVTIPVPGRHAHRRAPLALERVGGRLPRVPGVLGELSRLGPAHLAVVATVVAAAALGGAWWALGVEHDVRPARALASVPASTAPLVALPSEDVPSSAAPVGASSEPAPTAEVVVDVAGRVREPGIAMLPVGSRVADALEAAGGPRRGVDLTALNLARVLADGEQVLVGVDPVPGVAAGVVSQPGSTPPPAGATAPLVDLNTADEALLDTLPGVGPVTAAAITGWRTDHGGFSSVDELLEVSGIGEATLAELAPLVTV